MALSPMMTHYLETKRQYPDCILFYRLGDFYEMFFEDAKTASQVLELTLTGKDCGLEERAPMCGVPFHAVDSYISRLVKKGYKVAIAEQVEDPKLAKGLVKREVIRVVTPGTLLNSGDTEENKNNYLMCVVCMDGTYGISTVDVSTGDYYVTEVKSTRSLLDEIYRFAPSELVCNEAFTMAGIDTEELRERMNLIITQLENARFSDEPCREILLSHFGLQSLAGLGIEEFQTGVIAAGAVLSYLYETQKNRLEHLTRIIPYTTGQFMMLDTSTRRNLELVETLREKQKRGTLLWVLDRTKTAMGGRLLRTFIEQPLIDIHAITDRQNAVEEFNMNYISREEIAEYLGPVYDLERLLGRISYKTANPRDLNALASSLEMLPHIKNELSHFTSPLLKETAEAIDPLEDITKLIRSAIDDDPNVMLREGGIIREGYSKEADELRHASTDGKIWLANLEASEREKTGIKNLKIKYNKVFGYYFEVTNSFKDLVPDYFIRKQTLVNAERYTTDELKLTEEKILGSADRLNTLEYDLFCEVRDRIGDEVVRIQKSAHAVALVDVLISLSVVATRYNYVKPSINEKGLVRIKNGRHPVVERMLKSDLFVANDTLLDNGKNRFAVITGPNMAGKSTYMRQTALIVLMAQIGSFVPAEEADIGICDRIFTRVGASDDLASGQSTFMVEMTEVANILRNATRSSLIILDEIGRGTSTLDGLSIAWAVVEYVSSTKTLGAKTLFATHYHELTELEGSLAGVNNYCIAVREQGDDIIFLRKIIRGGADKSYGIQVGKLAGIPDSVIQRAKEILSVLSDADIAARAKELADGSATTRKRIAKQDEVDRNQLSFAGTVNYEEIIQEILNLKVNLMSPLEALNELDRLQNRLKNRWEG